MDDRSGAWSPTRIARVAGGAYLAIILSSIANLIFVESELVVSGDIEATAANIAGRPALYRLGLGVDLIMFAAVVFLAWALYLLLRDIDERLALLALLWRLAEAVLGAVLVVIGSLVPQLLDTRGTAAIPDAAQRQAIVDVLLGLRSDGHGYVIVFLCLGTIVFCWLLWRSRIIPRWIAGFGILACLLMLGGSWVNIVSPGTAELVVVGAPVILFELLIGGWLLTKGVTPPTDVEGARE